MNPKDAGGPSGGATNDQLREARQATFGTDLALSMSGPTKAVVGDSLEFLLTFSNLGPKFALQPGADVELTPALEFSSSSANCQEYRPPGGISCTLPQLESGESFEFTLRASAKTRPDGGTLRVRAQVNIGLNDVVDPNPKNNETAVRIAF